MPAIDPEKAKKVALAARAWQKRGLKERKDIVTFAKKRGISRKALETALKNPRKRLRKLEERSKLKNLVANEEPATVQDLLHRKKFKSTAKVLQEMNLKSIAKRTASRDRKPVVLQRKLLKRAEKNKRKEESNEYLAELKRKRKEREEEEEEFSFFY